MNYIDYLWLLWLVVSFICLIIELNSGDFYFICFAFGALLSLFAAVIGLPLWAQIMILAIASVLCIAFIRPPLVRKLHSGEDKRCSNADALIGKKGKVIETIPVGGNGYVKIDGDEWRSISDATEDIPVGTTVTVTGRDSIILKVVVERKL